VSDRPRALAGLRGEAPDERPGPDHATAREAALDAFGRAYERGALDALLHERDGDAVVLSPAVTGELARLVADDGPS
jgi:hypothetical protein